jgi:hypothetical protein
VEALREFRLKPRLTRCILAAVTLLILLSSTGITEASAYYSLTKESQTIVRPPEILLHNGTAGTSIIYTNNTSAKVSVEAPSVYDFVDNNVSNVDSNASIGTHSNFAALQIGPDSLFDILTETDNGGVVNDSENFVDDNTSNIDGVDDKGTHSNFTAQQYYDGYFDTLTEVNIPVSTTYQIHPTDFDDLHNEWENETDAWDWNNATSAISTKDTDDNIYWLAWNNTGQGTISQVDLRVRFDLTGLIDDYVTINWYVSETQGAGTYLINSTNQGTDILVTFNDVTEPINGTWEWTDIGNLEIRQEGGAVSKDDITYAVDEVWGWVSTSTPNYELDLEIRWTTADYDEANEYLCINVGTTDDEDLQVDVWTGSWTNLLSDLNASSWNNVSITSYLTSGTFIVRFLGGTESGDSNQDTWQIECSLLHVWSSEYNYNLDLEVQWTDANYTRTNEELCIRTGTTDTEDIEVYVWNATGSSWHKVFDDLVANAWNNVSVSTYLTDSNFTVRFTGTNKTGDATQSSWEIDASLLHMWNDLEDYVYHYDYILRVNNTVTDSWQIRLKEYSDSSIGRLQNCTIYFRNSTNDNSTQIVIENGSFNQTEGPWYNLTSLETIYITMTVEATIIGTSLVYTYLETRKPGTTTYLQYTIAFEIT